MAAAILFWQNDKSGVVDSTPTPEAEFVFDLANNEITALHVENDIGNNVEMKLDEDGKWIFNDPQLGVVDTIAFDSILSQLKTLRVLAKISPSPPDEDIGLDHPTYIIRLDLTDGNNSTIYTGKITPTESGYYVGTDKNEVVVVNKFGIDAIGNLLLNPPIAEKVIQTPNP
jgi:hypothetical protein